MFFFLLTWTWMVFSNVIRIFCNISCIFADSSYNVVDTFCIDIDTPCIVVDTSCIVIDTSCVDVDDSCNVVDTSCIVIEFCSIDRNRQDVHNLLWFWRQSQELVQLFNESWNFLSLYSGGQTENSKQNREIDFNIIFNIFNTYVVCIKKKFKTYGENYWGLIWSSWLFFKNWMSYYMWSTKAQLIIFANVQNVTLVKSITTIFS